MLDQSPKEAASLPGYRSASDGDRDFVYRLVEMTERFISERLRRWDETVERARIERMIERGEADILTRGAVPVGVVAAERHGDVLRLNLLRVLPIWQRRGYGGSALDRVIARADEAGLPISVLLSKVDPAADFYRYRGFTAE